MSIEKYNKKSSNIAEGGVIYDTETKELKVNFKGFGKTPKTSWYKYSGVPLSVWEELKQAESLGSFINKHIVKGDYEYEKVG